MFPQLISLLVFLTLSEGIVPLYQKDRVITDEEIRHTRSTDPNSFSVNERTNPGEEDEIRTAIVINQLILEQLSQILVSVVNNTSPRGKEERELQINKDCPSPFFRVNSECFYIHEKPKMDWMASSGFCQRLGGDLVEPETVELLQAVLLRTSELNESHFWVGASDLNVERQWEWISGKLVDLSQAAWSPGEPNDANDGEDCMEIAIDKYPALNDGKCNSKMSFICEHPNTP